MNVLHLGNTANVGYLLCYGLQKYCGVEATLAVSNGDAGDRSFIYGVENNPYGVEVMPYSSVIGYSKVVREALMSDVVHIDGGISLKQYVWESLHSHKVRHFHGSDLRVREYLQEKMKKLSGRVGEKVLVSTPDLLTEWPDSQHLPNPVDPLFFEPSTETEKHEVFLPTNLDNQVKGVGIAFQAWNLLREQDKDVTLKVIAKGKDSEFYAAKYQDDKRVVWLPPLTREEVKRELARSAVVWGQFTIPSLGLTELEAMALGKPVVTRYEQYYEGYDPPIDGTFNPVDIAMATKSFLSEKRKRTDQGSREQTWVKQTHILEAVSKRLMEIYESN